MPITSSAKKALRQSLKKAAINKPVRTKARSVLKQARQNPVAEKISQAFSALDKAAKSNIFHKNKVNRLKSRLVKLAAKTAEKTK